MVHELEIERDNPDGADQGFIGGYFPDLLDKPMFHPPPNNTTLNGQYRLPLGYQMDASYYCKFNDFFFLMFSFVYQNGVFSLVPGTLCILCFNCHFFFR